MIEQKATQIVAQIKQTIQQQEKKPVKKIKKRKNSSDDQKIELKERTSQKVDLNIFKNYNKTKKPLRIRQNITFDEFKSKINPSFTSKYFMIEIQWKKQGKYLSIDNEREWDLVMKQYKNQKINIKTLDQPYIEPARRAEVQQAKRKKAIQDERKRLQDQLNASITKNVTEFQKIFPHVGAQKIQKCFSQMVQNAQKWMRNELIYKYHPLKQKQRKLILDKPCSQCRSRFYGPYYRCLKCPQQYILCHQCEFKYCFQELKTHKNTNHIFAKIKDHKFTIKQAQITTTLKEDDPQKDFFPTYNHKTNNYQFHQVKTMERVSANVDRIKKTYDHTFKKEDQAKFKERYAKNLVSSIQRINFTGIQQQQIIPSIPVSQMVKGYQKFTGKTLQYLQNSKPHNPQDLRSLYYRQINHFSKLLAQNKVLKAEQILQLTNGHQKENFQIKKKQITSQASVIKQTANNSSVINQTTINQTDNSASVLNQADNSATVINQTNNIVSVLEQGQLVKKQQEVAVKIWTKEQVQSMFDDLRKEQWQAIQAKKKLKQGQNYVRPQLIYLKDLVPQQQQKEREPLSAKDKTKKYMKLKKLDIPTQIIQGYMTGKYQNYSYLQVLEQIKKINEKRQIKKKYRVYEQRQRNIYIRDNLVSSSSEQIQSDPEQDMRLIEEIRKKDEEERQQRLKKLRKQRQARDQKIRYIKEV